MSELSVGQLRGLTVNDNIISMPSGHSLYAPGHVVQVVSVAKTNAYTSTSSSFLAVTGLSATITPKFANSKILILAQISYGLVNNTAYGIFKVTRGGIDIYRGDPNGSHSRAAFGGYLTTSGLDLILNSSSINYLDSPNSTSALTYQLEAANVNAQEVFINRTASTFDNAARTTGASSITVMEIAQ
jgi:hypothetical protein